MVNGADLGKYSLPAEIRAMRPQHTMVKAITGGYYVYEYACEKRPDGKWRSRLGHCVGKIDLARELVPNVGSLRNEEVSALDFGEWAVALANLKKTLAMLR